MEQKSKSVFSDLQRRADAAASVASGGLSSLAAATVAAAGLRSGSGGSILPPVSEVAASGLAGAAPPSATAPVPAAALPDSQQSILGSTAAFDWRTHKKEIEGLIGAQPPTPGYTPGEDERIDASALAAAAAAEALRAEAAAADAVTIPEDGLDGDLPPPGASAGLPSAVSGEQPAEKRCKVSGAELADALMADDGDEALLKTNGDEVAGSRSTAVEAAPSTPLRRKISSAAVAAEAATPDKTSRARPKQACSGGPDGALLGSGAAGSEAVAHADPIMPGFDMSAIVAALNTSLAAQFAQQNQKHMVPLVESQQRLEAELKQCVKQDALDKLEERIDAKHRCLSEEVRTFKREVKQEILAEISKERKGEVESGASSAAPAGQCPSTSTGSHGSGGSPSGKWEGWNRWNDPWASAPGRHLQTNQQRSQQYIAAADAFEPEFLYVRGWSSFDRPAVWDRSKTQAVADALLQSLTPDQRDSLKPIVYNENHRLSLKVHGDGKVCTQMKHVVEKAIAKLQRDGGIDSSLKLTVGVQVPPEQQSRRQEVSQFVDILRAWAETELHAHAGDSKYRVSIMWNAFPSVRVGAYTVGKYKPVQGCPGEYEWRWLSNHLQKVFPSKDASALKELDELSRD